MLNNNDFNKSIHQIDAFQNNNNNNNNNFFDLLTNLPNNDSNTYSTNFFSKNVVTNENNDNNINMFDNLNNNLHFNNFQNKNCFNFFSKGEVTNNNSEALFTEVKKNISIFGNKLKNSPLFANNSTIENKNANINFRFDDYVSSDKSIFGNRLKERKPLFTNIKNENPISLNDQNLNNISKENLTQLSNQNNNHINYNYDQKDFSYIYNTCSNNDTTKHISNEINEKNNLFHNMYSPASLNVQNNLNVKSVSPFSNNLITNTSTNIPRYNDINSNNFNNIPNNFQYPYLYHNSNNKDTTHPNFTSFNEQNIINAQTNLYNEKNNFSFNEVNNLSNYSNLLQNNNILQPNIGNFNVNSSNINIPNQNNINITEKILKEQNDTNLIASNKFLDNVELNINKNELFYNGNKIPQKDNYELGYNNQINPNNNTNNSFEYNANSNFIVETSNINSLKEIERKNQDGKLNQTSFTNENEILFEKKYIENTQKKVLFFNENFIKSLELINIYNLNSYNENRSTIYTFPCYESFNNGIFYIKAIEECKNAERFDINDDLYNKIFSKNDENEMTVLKNININEKIDNENINLSIYYPLLHVEKIKFRQPLSLDNSNKPVYNNFELGKIPSVI
ncbi:conserved Plasmodium protein, unknown function [Plasmodium gallinaceum]|uniref:Uncharacterized protein n=1 Tax=Plasmodium gallinaceum TaxID=5849 RepID=A0A1J1GRN1_PLAGA|nr:conserved Plasmodium protein, unknown function [Plasmodium gallinaceum]CRG94933.1 conserved Plasmodium protein, unknown function [Plasmodium gallinaceum]